MYDFRPLSKKQKIRPRDSLCGRIFCFRTPQYFKDFNHKSPPFFSFALSKMSKKTMCAMCLVCLPMCFKKTIRGYVFRKKL